MDPTALLSLLVACAPLLHADTARALIRVESGFNPWAIGVVGGTLMRQPRSRAEALSTARALQTAGWNFSVGLGQINRGNFQRLGLTLETAFEPCVNLGAMQTVLTDCMEAAPAARGPATQAQTRLRQALSCYYSGNFSTGFTHGYVRRVARALPGAPP